MDASGGGGWSEERLRLSLKVNSLTVWELIDLLGTGYFSKGLSHHTLCMGINEVFQELILDVLKQVGADLTGEFQRFFTLLVIISAVHFSLKFSS